MNRIQNAALLVAALIACPVHADVIGLTPRQGDCPENAYVAHVTDALGSHEGCWFVRMDEGYEQTLPPINLAGSSYVFVNSRSIDFKHFYRSGERVQVYFTGDTFVVSYNAHSKAVRAYGRHVYGLCQH
jgi:hypothetical protein